MTLTPTQRLLHDIYAHEGPTVRLEARLTAEGAIEGLSVLVFDRTFAQTLHLELPVDLAGSRVSQLLEAAELWTLLLDGNASDAQAD
jgi:hypothetical protein